MTREFNIKGRVFGRLTAIEKRANIRSGVSTWLCICECGKQTIKRKRSLLRGDTKSCGCLKAEVLKRGANFKHGLRNSSEYSSWKGMLSRCRNLKTRRYEDYGGRGISVCDRWLIFENFIKDMGFKPSKKHTLDRENNDGNYEPGNCRWATKTEQANNSRSNRLIAVKGEIKTLSQWCSIYGTNYRKTYARILELNWTPERALGLEKNT